MNQVNQRQLRIKYVIDQQNIEISKNSMFKTLKRENFGSLAPLARNNLLKFLLFVVFRSRPYHEYTNRMTLLYWQNMWLTNKILRSRRIMIMSKTQKCQNFGSLAPLARNHWWNFIKISSLLIKVISWALLTQGHYFSTKYVIEQQYIEMLYV